MSHTLKSRDLKARAIRYGLLKDWYGEETAGTEIAAHTTSGELLADMVERYVDDLNHDEIGNYMEISSSAYAMIETISYTVKGSDTVGKYNLSSYCDYVMNEYNEIVSLEYL